MGLREKSLLELNEPTEESKPLNIGIVVKVQREIHFLTPSSPKPKCTVKACF